MLLNERETKFIILTKKKVHKHVIRKNLQKQNVIEVNSDFPRRIKI